jgi:hypothetical protein
VDRVALGRGIVTMTVNVWTVWLVCWSLERMYAVPILLVTWIIAAIAVHALPGKAIAIMTGNAGVV